jgi:parallel beta-helix repeat protein
MSLKSLAITAFCSTSLFAQGSLTPPGAPAPSMKTLGQIEPRTAIDKLPFKVSASGAYYLTGNLSVPAGTNGISIEADHVTIDLSGFTLKGDPSSLQGIIAAGARTDITVRNGAITTTAGGIDARFSSHAQIEKLRVNSCRDFGIYLGKEAVVKDCQANDNDANGIQVGIAGQVISCQANGNLGHGIQGDRNATIRDCLATRNGQTGVVGGDSANVISVSANDNSINGIYTGIAAHITDCTAVANGYAGIACGNVSLVTRANTSYNSQYGILVANGASVIDSSASNNALAGISSGNGGHVINCKVDANGAGGIWAKQGSTVRDCSAQGNSNDGISVTDRCTVIRNNCVNNANLKGAAGVHATGTDNVIQENTLTSNDRGLSLESGGNLVLKNTATNNTLNYAIIGDQTMAPVVSTFDPTDPPHSLSNFAF